jgi:hypothetical protein
VVTAEQAAAGSYRVERDGWIFVHLEGSPSQVGYQHGYRLSAEIQDLLRVTKPFLLETTKRDWAFYRDVAETILWPGIDEEYRAELDGIVSGLSARGVTADRRGRVDRSKRSATTWLDRQQEPPGGKAPATAALHRDRRGPGTRIVVGHNAWTSYITGGAEHHVRHQAGPSH